MADRKFSDKQEAEMAARYAAGESTPGLGAAFGVRASRISKILNRLGVKPRSIGEAKRRFTDRQEAEICQRYLAGENTVQLGEAYKASDGTIGKILKRNGVEPRSYRDGRAGLTAEQVAEVCARYLAGETTTQLGDIYGLTNATVGLILDRNGIDRRTAGGYGDSVKQVLESTGHHGHSRECAFYLYELARYSLTHCKPGITFDITGRIKAARGEYGAEVLRLIFATRQEAFFLEQAVLDATRGSAECPDDLIGWIGASEVRAMPADDLLPIVLRLAAELEAMGPWSFAAAYVPMTTAQRATCQQRAIACTIDHH